MPEFTLRDYLDIEAFVGQDEEEEEEEEFGELFLSFRVLLVLMYVDDLFDDDDVAADSTSEQGASWRPSPSPTPTNFAEEAAEIRARFARRHTGASGTRGDPLLYHLVPRTSDPSLWSIHVKVRVITDCCFTVSHILKPGYKSEIVLAIAHRTLPDDFASAPRVDISSAFAREGIPGYVFLEGELPEVAKAVHGLYYVFGNLPPHLVPLEQHVALLAPHNPLSSPIGVGHWVRCLHGPYRNDIGFVCGHRPHQDAETVVALVPQIHEKTDQTAKRKRGSRPEPRSWSCEQLEAAWGKSQVRRIAGDEYIFRGQNYDSGLIIMAIPSASLVKVDNTPIDLRPFLRAPFIRDMPTFVPWVHRFAQDSIKPGQWVKVESGDHQGAIGKPVDVEHSVASLTLTSTGNGPNLMIPLRALTPHYRCGDNVKCQWSQSCRLVSSVDEVEMTLTFVEKDSNNVVSANTWSWRCF